MQDLTSCLLFSALALPVGLSTADPATTSAKPPRLIWVDVDCDGRLDAWVLRDDGTARLLLQDTAGRFQDGTQASGLVLQPGTHHAHWVDLDEDCLPELVLAGEVQATKVWRNLGGGQFEDISELTGFHVDAAVERMEWLDVNGDGHGDLHLETIHSNVLFLGTGTGELIPLVLDESAPFADRIILEGGPTVSTSIDTGEEATPTTRPATARRASGGASSNVGGGPTVPPGSGGAATPPPGTYAGLGLINCPPTVKDQATGICVPASSIPFLGALYPLGTEFNIDSVTGNVGIGTTTPAKTLDVAGDINYSGKLFSTVPTGTPMNVQSRDWVRNLNVDLLDGYNADELGIFGDLVDGVEIADDAITDTNVSPTAAIQGTKVDPDFGAQDVTTTGNIGIGVPDPTSGIDMVVAGAGISGIQVASTGNFVVGISSVATPDTVLAPATGIRGETTELFGVGVLGVASSTSSSGNAAAIRGESSNLTNGFAGDFVGRLRASEAIISTKGSGAPFLLSSSDVSPNLNADLLDGIDSADFSQFGVAVDGPEIAGGAISDSHVASNAGIMGTKVAPDFGAQDVQTTGKAAFGVSFVPSHATVYAEGGSAAPTSMNGVISAVSDGPDVGSGSFFGISNNGHSVIGVTTDDNATGVAAGVFGDGFNTGRGVSGISQDSEGVYGESSTDTGVSGFSFSGNGVAGASVSGWALYGAGKSFVDSLSVGSSANDAGVQIDTDNFVDPLHVRYAGTSALRVYNGDGSVGVGNGPWPHAQFQAYHSHPVGGFAAPAATIENAGGGNALEVRSNGSHTTMGVFNDGTGLILEGFNSGGSVFEVRNDGRVVTPVLEITGGADLVESFDTGEEVNLPGTVLVIDDKKAGSLRASSTSYDKKVAGVVSGAGGVQPGIHLGQRDKLDGDTPVAMTGRVYVRCSAENGAITPGDRLTTASLTGHAMKATNAELCDGAVLGKAMSRLDEGTGLVLVLVNLQ